MINIPYEDLVSMILERKDITREELETRIKQKLNQLSGLISKEGAAHIVANELGVKLFEALGGKMKIGKILGGMRDIETAGKVVRVFEVREFEGKLGTGRVGSAIIADETGEIRLVFWNDMVSLLEKLKPGMIVRVLGAQARQNRDRRELHLNAKSKVVLNPPGLTIDNVKTADYEPKRMQISELTGNETNVEIKGTVVQVFDVRFYEVCPECSKRVQQEGSEWICKTHGRVTPSYSYVLNAFVDDGSGNIRLVAFGPGVEAFTGKPREELMKAKDDPSAFEETKNELLGRVMLFTGRSVKNEMFDRLEFVARTIKPLDMDKEIELLKSKVESEQQKPVEASTVSTPEPKVEEPASIVETPGSPVPDTEPAAPAEEAFDIDEELI